MTEQVNVFTPPANPPVNNAPAQVRQVEGTASTPSHSQTWNAGTRIAARRSRPTRGCGTRPPR
jgi:hypothetical protein